MPTGESLKLFEKRLPNARKTSLFSGVAVAGGEAARHTGIGRGWGEGLAAGEEDFEKSANWMLSSQNFSPYGKDIGSMSVVLAAPRRDKETKVCFYRVHDSARFVVWRMGETHTCA